MMDDYDPACPTEDDNHAMMMQDIDLTQVPLPESAPASTRSSSSRRKSPPAPGENVEDAPQTGKRRRKKKKKSQGRTKSVAEVSDEEGEEEKEETRRSTRESWRDRPSPPQQQTKEKERAPQKLESSQRHKEESEATTQSPQVSAPPPPAIALPVASLDNQGTSLLKFGQVSTSSSPGTVAAKSKISFAFKRNLRSNALSLGTDDDDNDNEDGRGTESSQDGGRSTDASLSTEFMPTRFRVSKKHEMFKPSQGGPPSITVSYNSSSIASIGGSGLSSLYGIASLTPKTQPVSGETVVVGAIGDGPSKADESLTNVKDSMSKGDGKNADNKERNDSVILSRKTKDGDDVNGKQGREKDNKMDKEDERGDSRRRSRRGEDRRKEEDKRNKDDDDRYSDRRDRRKDERRREEDKEGRRLKEDVDSSARRGKRGEDSERRKEESDYDRGRGKDSRRSRREGSSERRKEDDIRQERKKEESKRNREDKKKHDSSDQEEETESVRRSRKQEEKEERSKEKENEVSDIKDDDSKEKAEKLIQTSRKSEGSDDVADIEKTLEAIKSEDCDSKYQKQEDSVTKADGMSEKGVDSLKQGEKAAECLDKGDDGEKLMVEESTDEKVGSADVSHDQVDADLFVKERQEDKTLVALERKDDAGKLSSQSVEGVKSDERKSKKEKDGKGTDEVSEKMHVSEKASKVTEIRKSMRRLSRSSSSSPSSRSSSYSSSSSSSSSTSRKVSKRRGSPGRRKEDRNKIVQKRSYRSNKSPERRSKSPDKRQEKKDRPARNKRDSMSPDKRYGKSVSPERRKGRKISPERKSKSPEQKDKKRVEKDERRNRSPDRRKERNISSDRSRDSEERRAARKNESPDRSRAKSKRSPGRSERSNESVDRSERSNRSSDSRKERNRSPERSRDSPERRSYRKDKSPDRRSDKSYRSSDRASDRNDRSSKDDYSKTSRQRRSRFSEPEEKLEKFHCRDKTETGPATVLVDVSALPGKSKWERDSDSDNEMDETVGNSSRLGGVVGSSSSTSGTSLDQSKLEMMRRGQAKLDAITSGIGMRRGAVGVNAAVTSGQQKKSLVESYDEESASESKRRKEKKGEDVDEEVGTNSKTEKTTKRKEKKKKEKSEKKSKKKKKNKDGEEKVSKKANKSAKKGKDKSEEGDIIEPADDVKSVELESSENNTKQSNLDTLQKHKDTNSNESHAVKDSIALVTYQNTEESSSEALSKTASTSKQVPSDEISVSPSVSSKVKDDNDDNVRKSERSESPKHKDSKSRTSDKKEKSSDPSKTSTDIRRSTSKERESSPIKTLSSDQKVSSCSPSNQSQLKEKAALSDESPSREKPSRDIEELSKEKKTSAHSSRSNSLERQSKKARSKERSSSPKETLGSSSAKESSSSEANLSVSKDKELSQRRQKSISKERSLSRNERSISREKSSRQKRSPSKERLSSRDKRSSSKERNVKDKHSSSKERNSSRRKRSPSQETTSSRNKRSSSKDKASSRNKRSASKERTSSRNKRSSSRERTFTRSKRSHTPDRYSSSRKRDRRERSKSRTRSHRSRSASPDRHKSSSKKRRDLRSRSRSPRRHSRRSRSRSLSPRRSYRDKRKEDRSRSRSPDSSRRTLSSRKRKMSPDSSDRFGRNLSARRSRSRSGSVDSRDQRKERAKRSEFRDVNSASNKTSETSVIPSTSAETMSSDIPDIESIPMPGEVPPAPVQPTPKPDAAEVTDTDQGEAEMDISDEDMNKDGDDEEGGDDNDVKSKNEEKMGKVENLKNDNIMQQENSASPKAGDKVTSTTGTSPSLVKSVNAATLLSGKDRQIKFSISGASKKLKPIMLPPVLADEENESGTVLSKTKHKSADEEEDIVALRKSTASTDLTKLTEGNEGETEKTKGDTGDRDNDDGSQTSAAKEKESEAEETPIPASAQSKRHKFKYVPLWKMADEENKTKAAVAMQSGASGLGLDYGSGGSSEEDFSPVKSSSKSSQRPSSLPRAQAMPKLSPEFSQQADAGKAAASTDNVSKSKNQVLLESAERLAETEPSEPIQASESSANRSTGKDQDADSCDVMDKSLDTSRTFVAGSDLECSKEAISEHKSLLQTKGKPWSDDPDKANLSTEPKDIKSSQAALPESSDGWARTEAYSPSHPSVETPDMGSPPVLQKIEPQAAYSPSHPSMEDMDDLDLLPPPVLHNAAETVPPAAVGSGSVPSLEDNPVSSTNNPLAAVGSLLVPPVLGAPSIVSPPPSLIGGVGPVPPPPVLTSVSTIPAPVPPPMGVLPMIGVSPGPVPPPTGAQGVLPLPVAPPAGVPGTFPLPAAGVPGPVPPPSVPAPVSAPVLTPVAVPMPCPVPPLPGQLHSPTELSSTYTSVAAQPQPLYADQTNELQASSAASLINPAIPAASVVGRVRKSRFDELPPVLTPVSGSQPAESKTAPSKPVLGTIVTPSSDKSKSGPSKRPRFSSILSQPKVDDASVVATDLKTKTEVVSVQSNLSEKVSDMTSSQQEKSSVEKAQKKDDKESNKTLVSNSGSDIFSMIDSSQAGTNINKSSIGENILGDVQIEKPAASVDIAERKTVSTHEEQVKTSVSNVVTDKQIETNQLKSNVVSTQPESKEHSSPSSSSVKSTKTKTQSSASSTVSSKSDKEDSHRSKSDKEDSHRSKSDKDDSHRSKSDKEDSHRSKSDKEDSHRSKSDKEDSHLSKSDKEDSHRSKSDKADHHRQRSPVTVTAAIPDCSSSKQDKLSSPATSHVYKENKPVESILDLDMDSIPLPGAPVPPIPPLPKSSSKPTTSGRGPLSADLPPLPTSPPPQPPALPDSSSTLSPKTQTVSSLTSSPKAQTISALLAEKKKRFSQSPLAIGLLPKVAAPRQSPLSAGPLPKLAPEPDDESTTEASTSSSVLKSRATADKSGSSKPRIAFGFKSKLMLPRKIAAGFEDDDTSEDSMPGKPDPALTETTESGKILPEADREEIPPPPPPLPPPSSQATPGESVSCPVLTQTAEVSKLPSAAVDAPVAKKAPAKVVSLTDIEAFPVQVITSSRQEEKGDNQASTWSEFTSVDGRRDRLEEGRKRSHDRASSKERRSRDQSEERQTGSRDESSSRRKSSKDDREEEEAGKKSSGKRRKKDSEKESSTNRGILYDVEKKKIKVEKEDDGYGDSKDSKTSKSRSSRDEDKKKSRDDRVDYDRRDEGSRSKSRRSKDRERDSSRRRSRDRDQRRRKSKDREEDKRRRRHDDDEPDRRRGSSNKRDRSRERRRSREKESRRGSKSRGRASPGGRRRRRSSSSSSSGSSSSSSSRDGRNRRSKLRRSKGSKSTSKLDLLQELSAKSNTSSKPMDISSPSVGPPHPDPAAPVSYPSDYPNQQTFQPQQANPAAYPPDHGYYPPQQGASHPSDGYHGHQPHQQQHLYGQAPFWPAQQQQQQQPGMDTYPSGPQHGHDQYQHQFQQHEQAPYPNQGGPMMHQDHHQQHPHYEGQYSHPEQGPGFFGPGQTSGHFPSSHCMPDPNSGHFPPHHHHSMPDQNSGHFPSHGMPEQDFGHFQGAPEQFPAHHPQRQLQMQQSQTGPQGPFYQSDQQQQFGHHHDPHQNMPPLPDNIQRPTNNLVSVRASPLPLPKSLSQLKPALSNTFGGPGSAITSVLAQVKSSPKVFPSLASSKSLSKSMATSLFSSSSSSSSSRGSPQSRSSTSVSQSSSLVSTTTSKTKSASSDSSNKKPASAAEEPGFGFDVTTTKEEWERENGIKPEPKKRKVETLAVVNEPTVSSSGVEDTTYDTTNNETSGESTTPQRPLKVKSRWRRTSEAEAADEGTDCSSTQPPQDGSTPREGSRRSSRFRTSASDQSQISSIEGNGSAAKKPKVDTDDTPVPENQEETVDQKAKEEAPLTEEDCEDMASIIKRSDFPKFEIIQENIHLTERKKSKGMKRMQCDCTTSREDRSMGIEACGSDCLNRMLMIECGSRCPCGEYCKNKRFQKKQYAKTIPFKAGEKGWGLKALEDMTEGGTFIMEYVGELLGYEEFVRRTHQYSKNGTRHHYFMALNADEVVDATLKGSVSRFINHSCDPNCETQKWTVNGELRVGFFTRKEIKKGEELTFDYQFEHYGEAQKCYCGAANCRGSIGLVKTTTTTPTKQTNKKEKKKKKDVFKDELLEEDIEKLSMLDGMRNKNHVLEICRLMVRAEKVQHRIAILKILQDTTENACLKLFLDYHGLSLFWSWMADIGTADYSQDTQELKMLMLAVLKSLPINNKTVLKESKILDIVERWTMAAVAAARKPPPPPPPAPVVTATSTSCAVTQSSSTTTQESTTAGPSADAVASVSTCGDEEDQPIAVTTETTPAAEVPEAPTEPTTSSSSETTPPSPSASPRGPTPPPIVLPGSDITPVSILSSATKTAASGGKVKRRVTFAEEHEESQFSPEPYEEEEGNDGISSSTQYSEEGEGAYLRTMRDAKNMDMPGEAAASGDGDCDAGDLSDSSGLADSTSQREDAGAGSDNDTSDTECALKDPLASLAAECMSQWSSLKEIFKIPKKERVEERKRTERELDVLSKKDKPVSDPFAKWKSNRMARFSKRKISEDDDKKASTPKMSKEQRRQLFEAQVKAEDEKVAQAAAEELQRQQETFMLHQQRMLEDPAYCYYHHHLQAMGIQAPIDPNLVIPDSMLDPETGLPMLSQVMLDPTTGLPIIDPATGQPMMAPMPQVDPITGQPIPEDILLDPATGQPIIDPNTGQPMLASSIQDQMMMDPNSGQAQQAMIDPSTGQPLDPNTGQPLHMMHDPATGHQVHIDPNTGQPIHLDPNMGQPMNFDPNSGQPMNFDPNTGQPIQQMVNPMGGQMHPVPAGQAIDPQTGHLMPFADPSMGQRPMLPPDPEMTEDEVPPPPSPPSSRVAKLPPNWKTAKDAEGRVYYYHAFTRQTQWDLPSWDDHAEDSDDMDLDVMQPEEYIKQQSTKRKATTAAADTSSEVARKIKDQFCTKMSGVIVVCLKPYMKSDCKAARITSKDDFKHLARKLTHHVMSKELKHCKHVEDLEVNENVKAKAKDYVKKYMSKFGSMYKTTASPDSAF